MRRLDKAQAIIKRINRRDLYKFIGECTVPEHRMQVRPGSKHGLCCLLIWACSSSRTGTPPVVILLRLAGYNLRPQEFRPVREEEILAHQDHDGTVPHGLKPEDIIVNVRPLYYGLERCCLSFSNVFEEPDAAQYRLRLCWPVDYEENNCHLLSLTFTPIIRGNDCYAECKD